MEPFYTSAAWAIIAVGFFCVLAAFAVLIDPTANLVTGLVTLGVGLGLITVAAMPRRHST